MRENILWVKKSVGFLFNKTIPEFVLLRINEQIIVVKNQSYKNKLFYHRGMFGYKWHLCIILFYTILIMLE